MDFFSGSGTTGVVACKNDRKYIGIELNKKFCEESLERISNTLSQNIMLEMINQNTENKNRVELVSSLVLKKKGRPESVKV